VVGRVKGGAGSSRYCGGLGSPPVPASSETIGPATAAARRVLRATLIHVLPRLHHGRLVRSFFFIVLYATLNLIVTVCWLLSGSLVCNSTSITSFIARVPSGTLRLKTRFPFSPGATCGSSTEKASPAQPADGRLPPGGLCVPRKPCRPALISADPCPIASIPPCRHRRSSSLRASPPYPRGSCSRRPRACPAEGQDPWQKLSGDNPPMPVRRARRRYLRELPLPQR